MKNALRSLTSVLVVSAAFCAAPACVDTSPIDYHAPATEDAGIADAASASSDAARVAECRKCVVDNECTSTYDKCAADPRCKVFYDCLLDNYCVNFPGDLSKLPPCLISCGSKASILSSDDPVVDLFRGVLFCTEDKCVEPCDIPSTF
jgi:hypothetical protein